MSYTIRRVDYFYANVQDRPGEAYKVLDNLSDLGINLLAFAAVPTGPDRTQLTIFPEDRLDLESAAKKAGLELIGPYHAILVQGKDELGALVDIHQLLYQAKVNVYASNGVTNGEGSYGYVIYIRPDEYDRATKALEI